MSKIIRVNYTGTIKGTGEIFDTTYEEVAKKNNMHSMHRTYKPMVMILGENRIIQGLEHELEKMKQGDEKTIELSKADAYGERKQDLIQLVPLQTFRKNNVNPVPGMVLNLDNGLRAKVQSVSGGRVRLDMNHELAGKDLVFEVRIEEIPETDEQKARAVFDLTFPGIDKSDLKISIGGAKKPAKQQVMTPEQAVKAEDKTNKGTFITIRMPKSALGLNDYQARKLVLSQDLKKYLEADSVKIEEEY